jgi:hypothetical protein
MPEEEGEELEEEKLQTVGDLCADCGEWRVTL